MPRIHDFNVGDRVEYRWNEAQKTIEPEAYVGEITNVFEHSNDIVVRFDNGEWDQQDASNFKRENA